MKDSSRPFSACGSSVQQDWRAWLPLEKAEVFRRHQQHLESLYNMFSVSLNEAIELRHNGCLAKSLQALGMAAQLCKFFCSPLTEMLRALHEHSKHYGTIPSAAPLVPANFAGLKGQRSARFSGLLNHVLLSQRLQFLHKVGTIKEMVEELDQGFRAAAHELADAASMRPDQLWEGMAGDHYDLNTCLRETFVLLKSFLVVLPEGELAAFEETLQEPCQPSKSRRPARRGAITNGRLVAFAPK